MCSAGERQDEQDSGVYERETELQRCGVLQAQPAAALLNSEPFAP